MDTPVTEPSQPDPAQPEIPPQPEAPPRPEGRSAAGIGEWFASLFRSSTDRLAGGVAGGLAQRFGLPVLLVRVGFVLTAFLGIGFPLYVLGWALLPNERGDRVMGHGPVRDLVAVGAVLVAGLMLFAEFDDVNYSSIVGRSVPWLIILGGLALILRRGDDTAGRPSDPRVPLRPTAPRHPAPPAASPVSVSEVPPPPPGYQYVSSTASGVTGPRPLPTPRPPRPPRRRPVVGPLTWCVALLAVGTLGLIEMLNGDASTDIGPGPMAAVVMIVFGLGLTVSAFRGRARGLVLPALALAVGLAGLTALDVRADTTAGEFDRRISNPALLPAELESLGGSNRLDVSDLRLDTDRTVRIRQTVGSLQIVLPRETTTRIRVHVGTGSASVERPSGRNAVYDNQVTERWLVDGLPKDGTALTASELRNALDGYWGRIGRDVDRDGTLTFAHNSDHALTIDVDLGVGNLTVFDPRWADLPADLVPPTQLCTVGGGPRGVVEPCSDVAEASRVALCINEVGNLVDCREDRPGTVDWPRVAACRGADGEARPCVDVGIDPIGAELIVPGAPDADPSDTIAEPHPTDPSVAVEERATAPSTTAPSTTAPPDTIAPPTPQATVPAPLPVPTPGG